MKSLFLTLTLLFVTISANAESFLPKSPENLIVAGGYVYTCYAQSRSGATGEGYSTSINEARRLAIADCQAKSSGQSCRITRCY